MTNIWQNILHKFGWLPRYSADYNDIRPWPAHWTRTGDSCTGAHLWRCHIFVSCHKTGNTQTAIYGHLLTSSFANPFEPYTLQPATYHLPPTTYHLPPTTYDLPPTTYHLPLCIIKHLYNIPSKFRQSHKMFGGQIKTKTHRHRQGHRDVITWTGLGPV